MSVLGFQHVMSVDIRRAEVSPAKTVKQVAQEVTQSLRTTAGHDGKVSGITCTFRHGEETQISC